MKRANEKDLFIAKMVEKKRKDVGMFQAELARRLHKTPQQYHKYEAGMDRISASTMFDIAHVLGCKPDVFDPYNNGSLK